MALELLSQNSKYAFSESDQRSYRPPMPHIMVVDDENGPRQALRMLLKEDYQVHLAEGGERALEILHDQPIELVITDVKMPQYTGVELLREIKDFNADIQVIIFTGYGQLETAMKAVEYGAFAYLEKPFDNDVMLDMVRSAQGKYRQESERRAFENLALEASRFETLGRLVSGTMHDMGTPLTVLSSHIELMLMDPARDDITKRLETMKLQVQYCAEMTKATMNYLRSDPEKTGAINVNDAVAACIDVAKPLFRECKVKYETDLAETLPETRCEPVLMRQAIMNLINNACEAMSDIDETQRHLWIKSWTEDEKVCVSLENSGPNIPKLQRETVFESFFSTKGQSGTGLGLGVVKNVMRRFNGTASLEDGEGRGPCFVLRLPVCG